MYSDACAVPATWGIMSKVATDLCKIGAIGSIPISSTPGTGTRLSVRCSIFHVADRKEYMRKYQVAWLRERRQRAIDLLGGKCAHCGATEELEFDHIDPTTKHPSLKHKNTRTGMPWSRSWAWLEIELAKCQLLCTSCHKVKTSADGEPPHGTHSRYVSRKCRCLDCKAAHARTNAKYR